MESSKRSLLKDGGVVDEAQRVRHVATRTFRSIGLLNAPLITLLTATPMMNKGSDLHGILTLLRQRTPNLSTVKDYEAAKDRLAGRELTQDQI